ncbi:CaiB/BaiF CoA-transferase family protein [Pollutimonas sp. H1-120]|uniref:CaiB/BaiF CoA transferase family protein n=1 Tax=Pollutimonas sp. H1-120 TaxID=3148824 RepID=UPI003B526A1C
MKGALSHLKVLDMARILAGPWCTQNLADMGADVIKVERPGRGDDTRSWGPPWIKDVHGQDTSDSGYYASCNRNKRSITVDISSSEGQEMIRELAAQCDVFIENYKRGDLKRYGLDYESIKKVNPRIVYCSITGYGQEGPYADKPGYDFVFQGLGGIMSLTGERDDLPGGGPQKVGIALSDIMTGMYATIAILSALEYRNVSGAGQYIDMALLDCTVAMGSNQATAFLLNGQIPKRFGNAHAAVVPYQAFEVADGHIIVTVGNDGQWQRYCKVMGRPDLAGDERFSTTSNRIINRDALVPEIARTMLERSRSDWLETLEAAGVPCGPINNYKDVFEDPQVRYRELRVDVPRSDEGVVPVLASPLRLMGTPASYRLAPPALGEHTEQILTSYLGKSKDQIEQLRTRGVI